MAAHHINNSEVTLGCELVIPVLVFESLFTGIQLYWLSFTCLLNANGVSYILAADPVQTGSV